MPSRAPGVCGYPRCRRPTRERYCDLHSRPNDYDRLRPTSAARGYDRRWRKLRARILARDPICVECGVEPSTEVDHVIPRRLGGPDHPANLRGLCKRCHSRKTARGG